MVRGEKVVLTAFPACTNTQLGAAVCKYQLDAGLSVMRYGCPLSPERKSLTDA